MSIVSNSQLWIATLIASLSQGVIGSAAWSLERSIEGLIDQSTEQWTARLTEAPALVHSQQLAPSQQLAQASTAEPNQDRFLGPDRDEIEPLPENLEPVLPTPADTSEPDLLSPEELQGQPTLSVEKIEILGSTVFEPEQFAPITAPLEGRSVTFAELEAAAQAITRLYLQSGYITSSAVLAEQEVVDGVVTIQVVEGKLSDIEIEGLARLEPGYVESRLRLGADAPLRADRLEEQLRLLQFNPLFDNIAGQLQPGEGAGESRLSLVVDEANPLIFEVEVNNYSSPAVGSERAKTTLGSQNLAGVGDRFSLGFERTFARGLTLWDINYDLPLNAMDGTLQLRTLIDRNEVVRGELRDLGIEGESEKYEISFRQPLVRSLKEDFALSLGLSYRDGETLFGNSSLENRISVLRFGQDYSRRDVQGAWSLRSQFNFGLGLFNATSRDGNQPDSHFFSWLGQAQRVQRLGNNNLLLVGLDLQLSPDGLLGAEQFSLGGGQSLRGYRQTARLGDNGFRFSIEDRITVSRTPSVQLAPFLDLGAVWQASNNPNDLPDQTFLAGMGLGVLWEVVPNLNLRLDYGYPLVDLDDRGNNLQDDGLYFSLGYRL